MPCFSFVAYILTSSQLEIFRCTNLTCVLVTRSRKIIWIARTCYKIGAKKVNSLLSQKCTYKTQRNKIIYSENVRNTTRRSWVPCVQTGKTNAKGIYMWTQLCWYRRPENYYMAIYASCTESALHTFQIASVTRETVNNTYRNVRMSLTLQLLVAIVKYSTRNNCVFELHL